MAGGARRVLVTGFGAFPNAPDNPTACLAGDLGGACRRFERAGIALNKLVLPVTFGASAALDDAIGVIRPHVLLHFGLAGRRPTLTVETRAANRAGVLHPDAAGRPSPHLRVVPGAPAHRRVRFPVRQVVARLMAAGFLCRVSIDAGDYICNDTLFRSLARDVPCVGFIHVPRLHRATSRDARLTRAQLFRAAALAVELAAHWPGPATTAP